MKRSTRAMRLVILSSMFKHLKAIYHLEWPRRAFGSGKIADHELAALLAFKSDPRLNELHAALVRLENKEFGSCIRCGEEIAQRLLDEYPARRLCSECEENLNRLPRHTTEESAVVAAPLVRR